MGHICDCGEECGCENENGHSCLNENEMNSSSIEKIEKLKQAIADIGFNVEETEEGIRIS